MGLNDLFFELGKDLVLVLGVLAEAIDQVLGRNAGRLRAGKEESQALVDDAHISVFEVFSANEDCQEVTL